MAGKPNCLVFPVSRLWSHVSARLVSYVLSLCSAPREWDTISSERSRAEALFFFASFFFFSIRSLAKSGDMIYGKMVFRRSCPKNHGEWQRSASPSLKLVLEVARHSPLPCFLKAGHYHGH